VRRDRGERGVEVENAMRVLRTRGRRRDGGTLDGVLLDRIANGCVSGNACGGERRAQEANGKPAEAGFPSCSYNRNSDQSIAFIRAIIFLFAAFSFRFRRSLGFSKC
jgi:hypothetical protein